MNIVTIGTKGLVLFVWNIAERIDNTLAAGISGTGFISATIGGALNTSDIVQYFDHNKSSSTSQLNKFKCENLQKLIKYFNVEITSVSDVLLSFGLLLIILVF